MPIHIERPNGTVVHIPGDFRARAAFLREGRQVLQLEAEINGDLSIGPVGPSVMIVLPLSRSEPRSIAALDDAAVDIAVDYRR